MFIDIGCVIFGVCFYVVTVGCCAQELTVFLLLVELDGCV